MQETLQRRKSLVAFAQKIIYLKFGHLRNLLYGCLVPSAIEHAPFAQYAAIAHAQYAAIAQYAPFAVSHPLRPLVTTKGSRVG